MWLSLSLCSLILVPPSPISLSFSSPLFSSILLFVRGWKKCRLSWKTSWASLEVHSFSCCYVFTVVCVFVSVCVCLWSLFCAYKWFLSGWFAVLNHVHNTAVSFGYSPVLFSVYSWCDQDHNVCLVFILSLIDHTWCRERERSDVVWSSATALCVCVGYWQL